MTPKQDVRGLSQVGLRTQEPPISWLMSLALAQPQLISLAAGFTDWETLPVKESKHLLDRLLRTHQRGQASLQYGSTPGLPELRQRTADHLFHLDQSALQQAVKFEGLRRSAEPDRSLYHPDRLVMTHGSQQLLYLVTEALCDVGDLVLVEDPTYFVYLGILQSHGVECRGIRMQTDGLDLLALEEVLESLRKKGQLHRLKLLYLVSYFQNPTGRTTSFAKKKAALKLLRRYEEKAGHRIYLLEDAAYRELRFSGGDIPSSLVLDGAKDRVIYTSTYSKPFATGVRVGYGWLPPAIRQPVLRLKGSHDFGTSNLLQHLMLAALETGVYKKHVARLCERYARKAAWMIQAMVVHLSGLEISWAFPGGGLYVWATLPQRVRSGVSSKFFRRALDQGVFYVPGRLCYAEDPTRRAPDHELRLSFGSAKRAEIEAGIERLGRAARGQG